MRKILALFLVAALILALVPTAALAAAMPCGHTDADPAGHMPAGCGMPGHYRCDGKEHSFLCFIGIGDDDGLFPPAFSLPPTPPGKKPPANPPIKVEVPKDGSDADLKPKYEKRKEYAKVVTYEVKFTNDEVHATYFWSNLGNDFENIYVLNLFASGDVLLGSPWTGYGNLTMNVDMSAEMAKDSDWLEGVFDLDGPLEPVEFELEVAMWKAVPTADNGKLSKWLDYFFHGAATWQMDWKASVVEGSRITGVINPYYGETHTAFVPSADAAMPLAAKLRICYRFNSQVVFLTLKGLPDDPLIFLGMWDQTVSYKEVQ